jgi:hypothetical protein
MWATVVGFVHATFEVMIVDTSNANFGEAVSSILVLTS